MADKSIKAENYQENREINYTKGLQYERNLRMFKKSKRILGATTRNIYEYVRDSCIDEVKNHPQYPKFVWKPKIVDVGCGGGFGANIMSQEGDFVWGIDKDPESIQFAKELFERHKNNIYYTPQLTFDVVDVINEVREIMKFDIVVCVEVIEHIDNYKKLIEFLKQRCKVNKKGEPLEWPGSTKVYISSPNRNSPKFSDRKPSARRHIREWKPGELYDIFTKHFKHVTLSDSKGNPKDLDMTDSVMLFKCEVPILNVGE